jgi:tRNA-2-methylthio-N6-dimethylallyladenosine synthase
MNIYDSEKIITILENKGLKQNEDIENADLIVFNTCNIRDKAAHKLYSDIGRVNKYKKEKTIAVVGCVAQAESYEMFNKNKSIDIILGPQSYHLLPQMIDDLKLKPKQVNTDFIINEKFDYLAEQKRKQGISSYLTIQEGCDKFCSFCVVPYTRGPEYSRPLQSLVDEVSSLTENGAREIVLLGQNVNAFNISHNGRKITIADLIEEISKNKNVKRIRYTTSHPINMRDDLIKLHSTNDKLMPFLHLPVQSGSSKILKKMNRKYDTDFYLKIIDKLKAVNPEIEISSDFIIGYPGETESDFKQTLDLVDKIKFTQSFSFIYSSRPGTKSALEIDKTPLHIKKERLSILQEKLKDIQFEFNKNFIRKNVDVLIENQSSSNPEYFFGRTPFMQSVYIKAQKITPGEVKTVNILTCNHKNLYASC